MTTYQTALDISVEDWDDLTLDAAIAFSAAKTKATDLSVRSIPDGCAAISIVLKVRNQEELTNMINGLGQIQGVYQVKRASGQVQGVSDTPQMRACVPTKPVTWLDTPGFAPRNAGRGVFSESTRKGYTVSVGR